MEWSWGRRLMYFPDPTHPDLRRSLPEAEQLSFQTEDGLQLEAWFVPGDGAPPHPCVLVFPGNGGNRAGRTPLARGLAARGFAVLLIDYRGYGGNPGSPSETGLAADARAALRAVLERSDVDSAALVYFGESLGTGVAVTLATERPPAALVLRSPFTSLVDVARRHYPLVPAAFVPDTFDSIARIDRIGSPLLVVAGTEDSIVPIDLSRRLYEAAPDPKHLYEIPGADHNDWSLLAGGHLLDAVEGFLGAHLPSDHR